MEPNNTAEAGFRAGLPDPELSSDPVLRQCSIPIVAYPPCSGIYNLRRKFCVFIPSHISCPELHTIFTWINFLIMGI